MLELKKQKYDQLLQDLINAIKARDGDAKLSQLHAQLKERIREGTHREAIVQMLATDTLLNRTRFLCLYPGLIVPYLHRIKRPKS
jgi:hypothetical protein